MSRATDIFSELGFDTKQVRLPEGAVIYSIARTYSLIMQKLAQRYRRFRLSAASFNLLLLLQRGKDPGSFTQRRIGRHLVVSPSDMSGLIDRLERRGLVKRLPGKDRRSHLLKITPKGSALVEQVWPHHAEAVTHMSRGIDAADAKAVMRVLSSMRQAMSV